MVRHTVFASLAFLVAQAASYSFADDSEQEIGWPRFLGPTRDGHGSDTRLVDGWRSSGLRERWRVDIGSGSILKAVDASSGELLWRSRGFGTGSVIVAHEHLILLSDDGELGLALPSRAELTILDRLEVMDGRTWTPPSVAGGRIYLRSQGEIVCLEPELPR